MTTQPPNLAEPRDADRPAPAYGLGVAWTASIGILLLQYLFLMLFVMPRIEKEALDRRMKLAPATEWTIALSRWSNKNWPALPAAVAPLSVGIGVLVAVIPLRGRWRTGCWLLWLFLVVVPGLALILGTIWLVSIFN